MTRFLALGAAAVLVGLDQLLKDWAIRVLQAGPRIEVIPGLFYLTYVENRGAAFGILQNQTRLLAALSLVVLSAAVVWILSGRIGDRMLLWCVALIVAGGIGNCIDRIARGFVVDYLDFSALFGFPVFNFADCCVVVGTLLLLAYVLYTDRKKNKPRGGGEDPPSGRGRN